MPLQAAGVSPSQVTYATLCKGFALQGDLEGVAAIEKQSEGGALADADYLEVVEALCDGGHKVGTREGGRVARGSEPGSKQYTWRQAWCYPRKIDIRAEEGQTCEKLGT